MRELTRKPLDWFHPDPTQPRKDFDPDEIRAFGENLKLGQWVPVLARPDGMIIDGERRFRAAELVRLGMLDVIITDEPLTLAQIKEIQLCSAIQRVDLKPYEVSCACREWMEANPGATAKDLAAKLGKDPSWVSKMLCLWKCLPAVIEAAKAGRITLSDWVAMSKAEGNAVFDMLTSALNGAGRDALERKGRQARNVFGNGRKVSSFKIPCQDGTLSVKGDYDIVMFVDMLERVLKGARRAMNRGSDLKVFVASQKAQAKSPPENNGGAA